MEFESSDVGASVINAEEVFRRIRTAKEIIERNNLTDIHFWTIFREEFEDFTKNHFNAVNRMEAGGFRAMLRKRGVWVQTGRITAAKTLINTLKKEEQTQ